MTHDAGNIDRYRLKDADNQASARIDGAKWKAERIYLSDVALAVVMVPRFRSADVIQHKEELYHILRRLGQLAMEHDLTRPVACVLPRDDLGEVASKVERWGSDQGWHRGAFTLYVEARYDERDRPALSNRLEDLLEPRPESLDVRQGRRSSDELRDALEQEADAMEVHVPHQAMRGFRGLKEAVTRSVKNFEDDAQRKQTEPALLAPLHHWRDEVLETARRIKEGRE